MKTFCPECGIVMVEGQKCPNCEGLGLKEPECSCNCFVTTGGVKTGLVVTADLNCPLHGETNPLGYGKDHPNDCNYSE